MYRIIAALALIACSLPTNAVRADDNFPDVPKTHWAYQAVLDLKQKGILIGYPAVPTKGIAPKSQAVQKSKYDKSSPQSVWKSLMKAMRDGNESEIKLLLSKDCYSSNDARETIEFGSISTNADIRKAAYQSRARAWASRELGPYDKYKGEPPPTIRYALVDPNNGPDPTDTWIIVTFHMVGNTWQITSIGTP